MSELIKLGCTVADVYHRYHEIHRELFGVSQLRQILDTLRGRQTARHSGFAQTLKRLLDELDVAERQMSHAAENSLVTGADRELRSALLGYTRYLKQAVSDLESICANLGQDQAEYREARADGRSRFTTDKLKYDRSRMELERMGTQLERLFADY